MKVELRSILQQIGLPELKVPNVTEKCLDLAHIDHEELSQPQEIKNDTPCRLLLKDPHSGVLYVVTRGKTFPGEMCHQDLVGSDQLRVKLSIVLQEFETLPLPFPVPAYDLNILSDAVGSFVQWPLALVRIERKDDKKGIEHELMDSNSHLSRLSATPTKTPCELMLQSLSQDCQWLNTLISTMVVGESYNIYLHANLFYYNEERKIEVNQDDLKQFLQWGELNTSIIQIFIRGLQEDLLRASNGPHIGWLCPDTTADTTLRKKIEDAIVYVTNAFQRSALNGDEFILAPIVDSKHWMLLAICPQTYSIYEFDSIALKEGRKLYMKMVVLSALKRYKMGGGQIKTKRKEPL